MFGKQTLKKFYQLKFANKSRWFIFARAYIFFLQLAITISLIFVHITPDSDFDLLKSHLPNMNSKQFHMVLLLDVLMPLNVLSIPLHTLVCSVIGMDKLYILHLIFYGITWQYVSLYWEFTSTEVNYTLLVMRIFMFLAYWIFNIRTRILYLSKFRFAVNNVIIDNRTLFRRLFKWWIIIHLILVPYNISILFLPGHLSNFRFLNLQRALIATFEIKMYLALTPDTETWSYVFSRRSLPLEKFHVLCVFFYIASWILNATCFWFTNYGDKLSLLLTCLEISGRAFWTIRFAWLYFYAKRKLEEFVFQCIDEDSYDFDEFEVASKAMNPFESISGYEPNQSFINVHE